MRIATAVVIDDDKNTVQVFSDLLGLIGVKVVGTGYSGSEGINLYQKLKPDVIFVDIMMDDSDGMATIDLLKMTYSKINIVAVTADTSSETEELLKRLGVSVIHKPFSLDTIKHVLVDELGIKVKPES